jgi:hypothetical protein
LGIFLSGYALLKVSRTISMRSNAREWTHSAREYTMFEPTQLLRNWCEQRPSNHSDPDLSVTEEIGRVCGPSGPGGVPAYDLFFVPLCVIVVGLRFKW